MSVSEKFSPVGSDATVVSIPATRPIRSNDTRSTQSNVKSVKSFANGWLKTEEEANPQPIPFSNP